MIVITGGAGFIGSALLWRLNLEGRDDIVIVDDYGDQGKWQNLVKARFIRCIHKAQFLAWLEKQNSVELIVHLGACSSTAEKDFDYLLQNNIDYSISVYEYCLRNDIPLIYASSAATYGDGEEGYNDATSSDKLRPLNPYGYSKKLVDAWVMRQELKPRHWAGLKFFNVYGPNEYHKEGMRSLVCKAVPQIKEKGSLGLFKSYKDGYADGEQTRDFVYVKDVVDVIWHFTQAFLDRNTAVLSGIYNVGTGEARSFFDLAKATFSAMGLSTKIDWIEMPEAIRDGYQYYTQAELTRLRGEAGYNKAFTPLEAAVEDYVCKYLLKKDPYL